MNKINKFSCILCNSNDLVFEIKVRDNDKSEIFESRLATSAKNRLVVRTAAPPIRSPVVRARFLIKYPPTKKPTIEAASATVLTKAPISVLVKPISK